MRDVLFSVIHHFISSSNAHALSQWGKMRHSDALLERVKRGTSIPSMWHPNPYMPYVISTHGEDTL